jgi:hypothetical protein
VAFARAATDTARAIAHHVQAAQRQEGEQAEPCRHLQSLPHLQFGPQTQDVPFFPWLFAAFESSPFVIVFISCSRGLVIGREKL